MWCYGVFGIVKTRDDKLIKVDIKWDEQLVACGEIEKIKEILKKHLWNPSTLRKLAWRQDVQEYLRRIE